MSRVAVRSAALPAAIALVTVAVTSVPTPAPGAAAQRRDAPGNALSWPVDATPAIVSTFGEYRYDHLHAGVDISTGGRTGLKVRAAADGAIYRLKVEWRGYGRALYMRHADGHVTVYGHLQSYDEAGLGLESLVARKRAQTGTPYPGDIFIDPPIAVRRGQVIALSGESGVGLPHLHFEVRGSADDPIDPFRAGLRPPPDGTPPVIESIVIGAASPGTVISGSWREKTIALARAARGERVARVEVSGPFTATVLAWDPAAGGRGGLAQVSALVDGEPCYVLAIPGFRFEQYPVAGLIYDHRFSHLSPTTLGWRLGQLPGNTFARPGCAGAGAAGVFSPPPGSQRFEVVARDAAGLESRAALEIVVSPPAAGTARPREGTPAPAVVEERFHPAFMEFVVGTGSAASPPALDACSAPEIGAWTALDGGAFAGVALGYPEAVALASRLLDGGVGPECPLVTTLAGTAIGVARPGESLRLALPGASVEIPAGGRFFPGPLVLSRRPVAEIPSGLRAIGDAFDVLPEGEALDDRASLALAFDPRVENVARLGIFRYDPVTRRWGFEGDEAGTPASTLRCLFRRYGRFALLADEAPPKIVSVHPAPGSVSGRHAQISADVSEVGKGLNWDGVTFDLDGQTLPAEYDPDRGIARPFAPPSLAPGAHRLRVGAVDRAGNRSADVEVGFNVR